MTYNTQSSAPGIEPGRGGLTPLLWRIMPLNFTGTCVCLDV